MSGSDTGFAISAAASLCALAVPASGGSTMATSVISAARRSVARRGRGVGESLLQIGQRTINASYFANAKRIPWQCDDKRRDLTINRDRVISASTPRVRRGRCAQTQPALRSIPNVIRHTDASRPTQESRAIVVSDRSEVFAAGMVAVTEIEFMVCP